MHSDLVLGSILRPYRPLRRWRNQITFVPSNLGRANWQADAMRSTNSTTVTNRARHSEAGSLMASNRVFQDVHSVIAGEAS
jgi:hypothetical protein